LPSWSTSNPVDVDDEASEVPRVLACSSLDAGPGRATAKPVGILEAAIATSKRMWAVAEYFMVSFEEKLVEKVFVLSDEV